MMRLHIIALGLAGPYVLVAPVDQPLMFNLVAGVQCMAVAMAVTGTGAKGAGQLAGQTASLTPFFLLIAGAAALGHSSLHKGDADPVRCRRFSSGHNC